MEDAEDLRFDFEDRLDMAQGVHQPQRPSSSVSSTVAILAPDAPPTVHAPPAPSGESAAAAPPTNEDIKECNRYKLGYCPNGRDCRYRHAKLPGPPASVSQKIQQTTSFNATNRSSHNKGAGFSQQNDKSSFPQLTGPANQDPTAKTTVGFDSTTNLQQPTQILQPQQLQPQQNLTAEQLPNVRTPLPLPHGQSRYFIVKSCNKENLELSIQQGVWATHRRNEAKLNEAFETSENVILIFSINLSGHFQGCAKMASKIGGFAGGGNWKYTHGTSHYGRNFSVKWLKLGELSFQKTRHLRNPYNENLPVKISRDCQELEAFIGQQLATLLYDEPDSGLWSMLVTAESKREEEEKVKGVNTDETAENPGMVPYEDSEEDEDEESEEEEEEESFGQAAAALAGGRGRGLLWHPHMPLVHPGRPMLGARGFPPVMMGPDGFGFGGLGGGMGHGGFGIPDLFGPFGGPRFAGDLSGLVFPGIWPRQPGAGLGMMMGANPAPFMGGMMPGGAALRANRPMGMQPFRMPPPPRPPMKKDQRRSVSDRPDRYDPGNDQGSRNRDISGQDDEKRYYQGSRGQYDHQNEESESEDEGPRRRKRRRSHSEAPDR